MSSKNLSMIFIFSLSIDQKIHPFYEKKSVINLSLFNLIFTINMYSKPCTAVLFVYIYTLMRFYSLSIFLILITICIYFYYLSPFYIVFMDCLLISIAVVKHTKKLKEFIDQKTLRF